MSGMTVDGVDTFVTIQTDRLYQFGTDIGRKLESYLRTIPDGRGCTGVSLRFTRRPVRMRHFRDLLSEKAFSVIAAVSLSAMMRKWVILPSTEANHCWMQHFHRSLRL
jgi:hypothetical protein